MKCARIHGVFGVVLAGLLVPAALTAAPQAELWPRWESHDPTSTIVVDHDLWQEFIDEYIVTDHPTGVVRVDYAAVTDGDRRDLQAYIRAMEAVPVDDLSRNEQLPYWLNLYNAITVELILEHYPLDSIRDINRPWDTPIATVEGIEVTLNDIEHRIIRPIWMDPRIHYVINCASYGCPDLYPVALTGDNIDGIMDRAARMYLAHPRGVRFEGNRLILSSIFDWFQPDFGTDEEEVLAHIAQYAPAEVSSRFSQRRGRIRYEYDWALNSP